MTKAQTTLDAIQKHLNQVKLDCEQGPQTIALLGRLVLDDQGRKELTAKRPGPKTGSVIAVNNSGQFVPVGKIIDSVPLLNSQVPMPAGTPFMSGLSRGISNTQLRETRNYVYQGKLLWPTRINIKRSHLTWPIHSRKNAVARATRSYWSAPSHFKSRWTFSVW